MCLMILRQMHAEQWLLSVIAIVRMIRVLGMMILRTLVCVVVVVCWCAMVYMRCVGGVVCVGCPKLFA